jgi:translation elongation factor EF-G
MSDPIYNNLNNRIDRIENKLDRNDDKLGQLTTQVVELDANLQGGVAISMKHIESAIADLTIQFTEHCEVEEAQNEKNKEFISVIGSQMQKEHLDNYHDGDAVEIKTITKWIKQNWFALGIVVSGFGFVLKTLWKDGNLDKLLALIWG